MRGSIPIMLLALAQAALGQQARPINIEKSKLTVNAYKSGVFSFAGHDHLISAPIAAGSLDESARTIEFAVHTKEIQVMDPGESEKNRTEIRQTMLGEKLLDADKFPEIKFRSTSVEASATNFVVKGELTLHGVTKAITLEVSKNGGIYTGVTKLKQTDFGLTPVAVAGGTVKVKDEVRIEFSVTAK